MERGSSTSLGAEEGPIALTKQSTNADAQAFLNYLRSAARARSFEIQGFTVLTGGERS